MRVAQFNESCDYTSKLDFKELNHLMKIDDIDHLEDCVNALEACAFKLNLQHAFNVLQVIKLKSSF